MASPRPPAALKKATAALLALSAALAQCSWYTPPMKAYDGPELPFNRTAMVCVEQQVGMELQIVDIDGMPAERLRRRGVHPFCAAVTPGRHMFSVAARANLELTFWESLTMLGGEAETTRAVAVDGRPGYLYRIFATVERGHDIGVKWRGTWTVKEVVVRWEFYVREEPTPPSPRGAGVVWEPQLAMSGSVAVHGDGRLVLREQPRGAPD